jgi:formylglycine-generating enzyme required for sulfatase activity
MVGELHDSAAFPAGGSTAKPRMKPSPIRFVTIPGGRFWMGGSEDDKFAGSVEMPRHEVEIASFEMSIHPVTFGQMDEANPDFSEYPATRIDFHQAIAFAKKLAARLPTEAEWEYACRAGSSSVFPHGTSLGPGDANFLYDESGGLIGPGIPTPVGNFPPNAFGLFDMLGNVCEWTADLWHPDYQNSSVDGSAWLDGGKTGCRVIRGGAWDHLPRLLRTSWRDWAPESARWDNLGFRLARDIPR